MQSVAGWHGDGWMEPHVSMAIEIDAPASFLIHLWNPPQLPNNIARVRLNGNEVAVLTLGASEGKDSAIEVPSGRSILSIDYERSFIPSALGASRDDRTLSAVGSLYRQAPVQVFPTAPLP